MTKITYTPKPQRLDLEDYPHAIAKVRAAIARCDQRIAELQADIDRREANFEQSVANDADLRNDSQRRAALKERRYNDVQYQGWLAKNQQDKRTQHEIKLELLRGAFTVAKLQTQQRIADAVAGGSVALAA